ncbi:hypothetical protein J437_LFUL006712 [Ladona fulva]|uniref:Uncharacterized protein n=1 Tax=Ladona fulva TaxID=123851 RepID=A0A8K0JTC6_LADFU|nr:hypothetical protein J437_LFUL006712 [Ladona fulva]
MAQTTNSCRKRLRNNAEEEGCDFTPLSKRINNLHIHSSCCSGIAHIEHHDRNEETSQMLGYESPPWTDEAHSSPVVMPTNQLLDDRIDNCPPTPPEVSAGASNCPTISSIDLSAQGWISEEAISNYNPSLDSTDNPFYYETNKILFSLYWERMQRVGQNLF